MATREELVKQCRYYKGEEESPYEGVDQDKDMLWFYESHWVMSGTSEDILSDYHRLHISTDNISIPTSLKALLFNRFAKGYQSTQDAKIAFPNFLAQHYS